MAKDFWQTLEDNGLMWGDAARICRVHPIEILQWFHKGVPEGKLEELQQGIEDIKRPADLSELGL